MEIDDEDAPYLDLRDGHKHQAYTMLKHRSFGHTKAFDPDLLEKTDMDIDFAHVCHAVGWDVMQNGSRLLTNQFLLALFGRKVRVFLSDFLGTNTTLLW